MLRSIGMERHIVASAIGGTHPGPGLLSLFLSAPTVSKGNSPEGEGSPFHDEPQREREMRPTGPRDPVLGPEGTVQQVAALTEVISRTAASLAPTLRQSPSLSSLSSVSLAPTALDTTLADTVADTVRQETLDNTVLETVSFVSVRSPQPAPGTPGRDTQTEEEQQQQQAEVSSGSGGRSLGVMPGAGPPQLRGTRQDPLEEDFATFLAWKAARRASNGSDSSSAPAGQQQRPPRHEETAGKPQEQRHTDSSYKQNPPHTMREVMVLRQPWA